MKKNILLFIISCIYFFEAKAQTYTPLHLDVGTSWVVRTGSFTYPGFKTKTIKYTSVKDTIMKEFTYYKFESIYFEENENMQFGYKTYNEGTGIPFYLRNDTIKKTVYSYNGNLQDILIYDFFKSVGDFFYLHGGITIGSNYKIDSVNVENILGVNRTVLKKIDSITSSVPYQFSRLIEGIGSEQGFIDYTIEIDQFEFSIRTLCVKYNGQTLYGDTSAWCDLVLSTQNNSLNNTISIFPNPAQNKIFINANEEKITSYCIKDILGKTLLKENLNSNQIDISTLSNGIYFIQFQNDKKQFGVKKFVVDK
ncbi:MAG: T9SS type A sorting domain-containing protein [Chitinophagaceae bacterium]|nr:T9SS type A sorting domain-containing protein [Chitinophagaceae bacterium]